MGGRTVSVRIPATVMLLVRAYAKAHDLTLSDAIALLIVAGVDKQKGRRSQ